MRLSSQPKWVIFAWELKIISITKVKHLTSFWYRGPWDSEMDYWANHSSKTLCQESVLNFAFLKHFDQTYGCTREEPNHWVICGFPDASQEKSVHYHITNNKHREIKPYIPSVSHSPWNQCHKYILLDQTCPRDQIRSPGSEIPPRMIPGQ